ncbi:MAG: hypothetical protein NC340_07060 [Ruminococcus flavefaciens]|nr:hypothetical protein [Ruminococcus flavefaciens]MCM1229514.1 hypothetical protein [Ruminococcus flavefaciens]
MKKFLLILCLMPVLIGCSTENQEIIESPPDSVAETTAEATTETVTESTTAQTTAPEKTEPIYTEISDNIKLYDLNKPENSELIPPEEIFYSLYPGDIEMAGYGILSNSDGNIKLVNDNGEENIIVESPYPDNAYSWVKAEFQIDSDRFAYSVCGEWGNTGFGVYDLKSGENHLIMEEYYPKVVRGNSLILAKEGYFNTVGYSEFDLDSYEIRDIPLQTDLESLKYRRTNDVTADGRLSAVIRYEDDSYIITVISLESGEVAGEYILKTDVTYGNIALVFTSADKLHLYAKRHEDNTYHLYVFDI